MISGRIVSLVLGSLCMLTTAAAADLASSSSFELIDNRVFVSARLDGQGPYSFLLDTGADGWTVSAKVARGLALAQGQAEQIEGVGEAKDTVHRLTLREVTLAGLSFADQPAFDYPQRRIVLHRDPDRDVPDPADRSGL